VVVIAPQKGVGRWRSGGQARAGSPSPVVSAATHWAAERCGSSAGFQAVHAVPRRAEALTEIMTGRVDYVHRRLIEPDSSARARCWRSGVHAEADAGAAGRATTPRRAMPTVTAVSERHAGAGEDAARHCRLHQEVQKVLALPAVKENSRPRASIRCRCAGRVRRADQEGDRHQRRAGEGGRHQVQLNKPSDAIWSVRAVSATLMLNQIK
jgi:hypothetical protein